MAGNTLTTEEFFGGQKAKPRILTTEELFGKPKTQIVTTKELFGEKPKPEVFSTQELLEKQARVRGVTVSWAKPPLRKRIRDAVVAAPKGALQIIASTPQVAASFMQEWAERKPFFESLDPFTEEQRVKGLDLSQKIIQKNRAMIERKGLLPDPDAGKVERFLYDLGGGATTLAGAIGITALTKSPHSASVLFGLYQKGQLYQEAREAGVEPKKASALSTIGGGIEGALEYVGLDYFFKNYGGRLMTHAVRGVTEYSQEWSQEFGENLVVKLGWDKTRELTRNCARAGIQGFLLGVGASVVVSKLQKEGSLSPLEGTEFDVSTPQGEELIEGMVSKGMEEASKELESVVPLIEEDITPEVKPLIEPTKEIIEEVPVEKPPAPTKKPIETVKPVEGVYHGTSPQGAKDILTSKEIRVGEEGTISLTTEKALKTIYNPIKLKIDKSKIKDPAPFVDKRLDESEFELRTSQNIPLDAIKSIEISSEVGPLAKRILLPLLGTR